MCRHKFCIAAAIVTGVVMICGPTLDVTAVDAMFPSHIVHPSDYSLSEGYLY